MWDSEDAVCGCDNYSLIRWWKKLLPEATKNIWDTQQQWQMKRRHNSAAGVAWLAHRASSSEGSIV
jgi:predicted PhzF superfamily epimerase YddE/YHI9